MVLDFRVTGRDLELLPTEAPWTLIQGEALDTLRTLPDGLADALITDEPYSSGGMMRSDRTASTNDKYSTQAEYLAYSGDNRDARSWAFWCVLWLTEAMRVVKPGGYLMMFTDWRQLPLTTDVFQGAGAVWRGIINWDKGPTARAPHTGYARHQCEYIVWGTVGTLEPADGRGPFPGSYTIPVDPDEKEHQAGKPIELMRKLARMVPPDGLILDCFAGSSSTGVGALLEGRRFLGIEREPYFVETSRPRLERAAAYRALTERQQRPATSLIQTPSPSTTAPVAWRWRTNKEQPQQ